MENEPEEMSDGVWSPSQPRSDQKIWRYIDFPHFYSLLNSGKLWFRKNAEFYDPYEGILPEPVQGRLAEKMPDPWTGKPGTAIYQIMRYVTFSNCWHMNKRQSMAMWQTYNNKGKEIAIESRAGNLVEGINYDNDHGSIVAGEVEYIEYDDIQDFPLHNISPYFHKRKSFEHEKEFRVVIQDFDQLFSDEFPEEGVELNKLLKNISEKTPPGIERSADLNHIISKIHISPVADDWLKSIVEDIVENSDYLDSDTIVEKSEVTSEPEYWQLHE